jgi:phosphoenolpyruvate carboxykinase (ATP)
LATAPTRIDPHFGFAVPLAVEGVSAKLLDPRANWRDPAAYDVAARSLAQMFVENARRLARAPVAAAAE